MGDVYRKIWRLKEEEAWGGTETDFRVYGNTMDTVKNFRYFVQLLNATNDERTEVIGNLSKAWQRWARISQILGW